MYYRESIYFSIATKINLKKQKDIGKKVILSIKDFCFTEIFEKMMITYDDIKGHKKPILTQKNFDDIMTKYLNEELYGFITITDYLSASEYYDAFEDDGGNTLFESNIDIRSQEFCEGACNTVTVSIATRYFENEEKWDAFYNLFFKLHTILNGFGSFITRGSDIYNSTGIFDSLYYSTELEFSKFWEKYVRGYYPMMYLTIDQIDKLGGIGSFNEYGFYKIDINDHGAFIWYKERIADYSYEDAIKLREFYTPLFPPKDYRKSNNLPHIDDFLKYSTGKLLLFQKEDLCRGEQSHIYGENTPVLESLFADKIEQQATKNGFTREKNLWYRVKNGVFTAFHAKMYDDFKKEYDLECVVYPACDTFYITSKTENLSNSFKLAKIAPARPPLVFCVFDCSKSASNQIKDAIWSKRNERYEEITSRLIKECENYVFSFFEKIDTPLKCYMTIRDLHEKRADGAIGWNCIQTPLMCAFQMKNWNFAMTCLKIYLTQNKNGSKQKEYSSILEALKNENFEFVETYIRELESEPINQKIVFCG